MITRKPLKWLFYANVLIVALLLSYKLYLNLILPDFQAEHSKQLQQIRDRVRQDQPFSFAVLGNINNSVGIFERRIVPKLNRSGVDFMVSAGNAVSGGGEDKYRALQGSLGHLAMPYLLTFGDNEHDDFGSYRFYEHFGPHFFSFRLGDSRFIFLDSSGKTPWKWQIFWLEDLLRQGNAQHTFMFTGHPLLKSQQETLFDSEDDYLQPQVFRDRLLFLIRKHDIDAVFSANLALYDRQQLGDSQLITTGGAGGLVLNQDHSFYHYIRVSVADDKVDIALQRFEEVGQHALLRQLEGVWFAVYSLFYVGYLNFILIISALIIVAIKLHALVFVDRDYYPNFNLDPTPWLQRPLNIAMFSNNYLPFIGGVPLSIERLRRGLQALGNKVWLVAPRYPGHDECREENVLRLPALITMGAGREFRLANIFLWRTARQLRAFKPDVVHVHHPFWLGSLGAFLARRLGVPLVYTYHTRLEHYAHFVPLPGALFRNLISHALIKRFANKCDGVIVPTYSAEEYLRMIGVKSAIHVQPTGIEFQRFQAVGQAEIAALRDQLKLGEEIVMLSVSRLSNEKNIDFMLDALAQLKSLGAPPFRLLIIGDGQQRSRLQQRIDSLDMSQHISLLGAVPPQQMPLYYRLGELFLFASKSETQGMVILEAMAAGLPVVAVRSSGIDDVVRHQHNGFKTPEDLMQWQTAVRQLLEDSSLRQQLGNQARDFARQFSVENFARDVKKIYALLLAQRANAQAQRKKPKIARDNPGPE